MHDGSIKTLKDVVDYYIGGGNSNPRLDKNIHVLDFLSGQERADLLAFLKSLNGEMPPDAGPPGRPRKASRPVARTASPGASR
jgi:cytochrome c peroxidase